MRKYAVSDFATMRWKNGGGVTTQLAVAPPDAGLDDFNWRISTAQVTTSGLFSRFVGIDRSLAVLHGNGLTLQVDGDHSISLAPGDNPLYFPGERQVDAILPDGPITDFNVMTRRASWSHELQLLRLSGTRQLPLDADVVFIYCVHGTDVRCQGSPGEQGSLSTGEAILFDGTDSRHADLSTTLPADLYIVYLRASHAQ